MYGDLVFGAPLAQTRNFNIDKNNFGPRAGLAWSMDDKTVIRGSMGIMYDQAILGGYEQALQLSGSPRAPIYTFSGTQAGAPAFPAGVTTGTLAPQSPWAISQDFVVAHTWQNNVQFERGIGSNLSATASLMYAKGYDLPVVTNINPINPIRALADGRPVFSTTPSAATRLDPRFNQILEVQSIGDSTFKSMTVGLNRRLAQGISFNLQYSLGKGLDTTPLVTQLTVQSEAGRSDPTNIERDRGPNPLDIRHSFNGNVVYISSNHSSNAVVRQLLSGNEIGVILQINSGLPVNISAVGDLNGDGINSDRPLFVGRNSLYLAPQKIVDLRYTRWIPVHGSVRGEIIAEFKNLFNAELLSGITTSFAVDAAGNPTSPIPDDPYQFVNPSGAEQRKFQLGFKVRF
jgi:hypothetical protein